MPVQLNATGFQMKMTWIDLPRRTKRKGKSKRNTASGNIICRLMAPTDWLKCQKTHLSDINEATERVCGFSHSLLFIWNIN